MTETREIQGLEGRYSVSSDGRVFSARRTINMKNGKARAVGGSEVKPHTAGSGYRSVVMGRGRREYIHRLVANAFIGQPTNPGMEVDHINRDKTDNRVSNLRWISHDRNLLNAGVRAHNTSGVNGVRWHSKAKKWCAYIGENNKYRHIGLFSTLESARSARIHAEDQRMEMLRSGKVGAVHQVKSGATI
jgi:hypothetical protein